MAETELEPIALTALSRKQRRVLGVLLEKGFTTPDQYPLTLKATTTGCNQKNNREPLSSYDEESVLQTLQELAQMGFVGILHTESGRTERYRHYLRHRSRLTEPQLAILTELLLRGKQQPGELRTRASRMVPIDTLELLRAELQTLMDQDLVRANGPLERRGVEVDHALYPAGENHKALGTYREEQAVPDVPRPHIGPRTGSVESPGESGRTAPLEADVAQLKEHVAQLREQVAELVDQLDSLRRHVGM
jgi:uncharacterized protein YceH (UPF0502 family)